MLLELKVSNFAIIDNINIQFQSGLNILSGETGAGKSVLLKSLGLMMGANASTETVRTGCKQASIEGLFDLHKRKDILKKLDEHDIEIEDSTLIVRRVISAQGKSRVYINGVLTSLHDLREVVAPLIEVSGQNAPLIEMTGQHENRNLQFKSYHLEILDQYGGSFDIRQEYFKYYKRKSKIEKQIAGIESHARDEAQKLDYLLYQKTEIESLDLQPGEEVNLENKVKAIKNLSRIIEFIQMADDNIDSSVDSALSRVNSVIQNAQSLVKFDPNLAKKVEPLEQVKAVMEDVSFELTNYAKTLDIDPSGQDALEEKLSSLRKLQKKFGPKVVDILEAFEEIKKEINEIENSDQLLIDLRDELVNINKKLQALSEELHTRRVNGATLLTKGVNQELKDLNMKGLIFEVRVEKLNEFNTTGFSDVEFMTRTSKSDKAKPMAKFASGGELSRILLSIKRIVGTSRYPRTYLFDEVDAGVSGETAEKVGKKLKSIARGQQVICVTHLPQVASCADVHFLIEKSPIKNEVKMDVIPLKSDKQVNEIARLISGEKITGTSVKHAQELLKNSTI